MSTAALLRLHGCMQNGATLSAYRDGIQAERFDSLHAILPVCRENPMVVQAAITHACSHHLEAMQNRIHEPCFDVDTLHVRTFPTISGRACHRA
jgi:hypothetical protein